MKEIFKHTEENPQQYLLINLPDQTISISETEFSEQFEINSYKKMCMLNGYDDIDFLLSKKADIEAFEKQHIEF